MIDPLHHRLSRRERQIMDAVYALEAATANEVVDHLGEEEAYDSIRVTLGNLANKGLLTHEREGRSYVYEPAVPREKARQPAMEHLKETFFSGSSSRAILAFLDMSRDDLSPEDLDRIASWIDDHADDVEEED